MNVIISEKKVGQILCYALLVLACVSGWTLKTELLYTVMFTLDGLLIWHAISNYIKPRVGALFILIIFLYFLSRTIRGLNIISSINSCKGILLWLTVFISTFIFFDSEEHGRLIRRLPLVLIPHTFLVVAQFAMGLGVDHIGGIFGTSKGVSNAGCHVLIILSACVLITLLLNKEIKVLWFVVGLLACMLCAGIAEIKFYLFELVVFALIYSGFTKNLWKSILAIFFIFALVIAGIRIIVLINPSFGNFFSIEGILKYLDMGATGFSSSILYISRVNGYPYITLAFFENDFLTTLFGKGFGSDVQTIADTLHCSWFTYTSIYLAGGIIGSLLVYAFLIGIIHRGGRNTSYFGGRVAMCAAILALITFFYDAQLWIPCTSTFYFFVFAGAEINRLKEAEDDKDA